MSSLVSLPLPLALPLLLYSLSILLTHTLALTFIGLTGGIATGKSTVTTYLRHTHHTPIIDFDLLTRELVHPHSYVLRRIQKKFGAEVILDDGNLDRAALGRIIFNDAKKRRALNGIYKWPILALFAYKSFVLFFCAKKNIIFLDVPLLFEGNFYLFCRETVVIFARPEVQLERLKKRDGVDENTARSRINAQMDMELKKQKADFIIDNNAEFYEKNDKNNQKNNILFRNVEEYLRVSERKRRQWTLYNTFVPSFPCVAIVTMGALTVGFLYALQLIAKKFI